MEILYLGTVCNLEKYKKILDKCRKKPTVATAIFESALLEGFSENNADIQILSYPMIPTFPDSPYFYFGGHVQDVVAGYNCYWLQTINLPLLKQLSRRFDACRAIKRWAKKHAGEGVFLLYSIPPFLAKDIIKFSKKYSIKTAVIVPDLLQNMYINHKINPLVNSFRQLYLNPALNLQGDFDGYIYLTEAMKETVAPQKPYIVMEGVLNKRTFDQIENSLSLGKASPKAVMYAGRLHEKYGVINLLDAFDMLGDLDIELWLFGEGTAVEEIRRRGKRNLRIRYFGSVSHEEILQYEKKATLLVNPRSSAEEFTKYSFPSKTIEYMFSGTPLLTTKLSGIPKEYFEFVFSVEDNTPLLLSEAMRKILSLPEELLLEKGSSARQFILTNKKAIKQSERILNFLKEI